jgi:hypothetical protein
MRHEPLDIRDIPIILSDMLQSISADGLAADVTEEMYRRALALSAALGAKLGEPRSPRVATDVKLVVEYAQKGRDQPNERIVEPINRLLDLLSATCFPPATLVARAVWDRKAGEPRDGIEVVLLAARARLQIELGWVVAIRWLAVLGGVSVKTARNLASAGQLKTHTTSDGQVATAAEAARWLRTRGVNVVVGFRGRTASSPSPTRSAARGS